MLRLQPMACPFFYPIECFDDKTWTRRPRMPLGDPYSGFCHADPMREWMPDQNTLRENCNLSARGCPRFRDEIGPDAVRFSVISDRDDVLKIFYVRERDNATLDHGVMEYSVASGHFVNGSDPGDVLRKQALAYAESYLRRKQQPDLKARNPHRR